MTESIIDIQRKSLNHIFSLFMRQTNLTFGQNGDEVKPLTTNEIKPLSEDERRTLSRFNLVLTNFFTVMVILKSSAMVILKSFFIQ